MANETFKLAKVRLLLELREHHWKVVLTSPSMQPMKIPHATSPDGRLRLWFKPQAVYLSVSYGSGHSLANARSLWVDIRNMPTEDVLAAVERHMQ